MFLLYVVLVTIMFSSAYCAGGICDASEFPDENARPVADEIETAKYSGRWYPAYGNVYEMQCYLKGDFCPLNDFTYVNDLACDGNNTVRVGAVNGTLAWSPGLLAFNRNNTGRLKYVFFGYGQMNYLVSKVGPATFGEDNLYQYAVVWSPNFYNSFVLARDVAYFNENYKTEVFAWMRLNGFAGWFWNVENGEIYQESDCEYPPQPEPN